MNLKTMDYLYHKSHGLSSEEICAQTGLSPEEVEALDKEYTEEARLIARESSTAHYIGEEFLRLTRYIYSYQSDQEKGVPRPPALKSSDGPVVSLPAIGKMHIPQISLHQAIEQRRSLRKYSDQALTQDELSFLLWSSSWARDFRSNERMEITFRNVPSAGARHPLECYLQIRRVEGIKPGLYHYQPVKHCLILISDEPEKESQIFDGCFHQEMVGLAAVNFIWTAIPYRTAWRYTQRAYRYLYLDAGHVGQNLHLACEAIGAGACMIGAYSDEIMNDVLGLNEKEEFVIYIAAMGKKPKES